MSLGDNPGQFPDWHKFVNFVKTELGDVPVLDNGGFISPKIAFYWACWRINKDLPDLLDRMLWGRRYWRECLGPMVWKRQR